ncbi:hypothetical protein [Streptomyces exfoliatus]|uniref:hypothetical protein n=1 Tax=Streptomyces exfoliatus TaxID=1905 RepID=UPI003C2DACE9
MASLTGVGIVLNDAAAEPGARHRRIEFIGDSNTVGYGNRSTSRDCNVPDLLRPRPAESAPSPPGSCTTSGEPPL